MEPLRQELEAPPTHRQVGAGWISGALGLALALVGLGAVLCLRFPDLLVVPEARRMYNVGAIRAVLHMVLVTGFVLGIISLVLRQHKALGATAIGLILIASVLGGSQAVSTLNIDARVHLGLDWFLLNLIFSGILFIPLERWLGIKEQPIFRFEWREDLFYFLVSSLLVQVLTYLSLAPSMAILRHTDWGGLRAWVGNQPVVLQFFEIMFLTDLVQYWVHRLFHRLPILWKFHAVHHSAQALDWLAGSRMHVVEIIVLRGATVVPMYVLGFSEAALYAYLILVYFHATLVHSNVRLNFGKIEDWLVTPKFHHWHHGIEKEAVDVNFAVHFPIIDRVFGTFYLPPDRRWPDGYGVAGHPVPKGFLRQLLYPFRKK